MAADLGTLTFGHDEARALYEALDRYYGPHPTVIVPMGADLTEEQAAEFRKQLKAALEQR